MTIGWRSLRRLRTVVSSVRRTLLPFVAVVIGVCGASPRAIAGQSVLKSSSADTLGGSLFGLDVRVEPLTDSVKAKYELIQPPYRVTSVTPNSPAAAAGIHTGDLIVALSIAGENPEQEGTNGVGELRRLSAKCLPDCLVGVIHDEDPNENGFIHIGSANGSFTPVTGPASKLVIVYRDTKRDEFYLAATSNAAGADDYCYAHSLLPRKTVIFPAGAKDSALRFANVPCNGNAVAGAMQAPMNGAPGSQTTDKPLTNADIVAMSKAGISADVISLAVQTRGGNFDTSAAALIALRSQGVPDALLNVLISVKNRDNQTTPQPFLSRSGSTLSALSGINVTTQNVTPDLKSVLGRALSALQSVVTIAESPTGSPAANAAIHAGDVIWAIADRDNFTPIMTEADFRRVADRCSPGCLISLYHPDRSTRNGFIPVGSIDIDFDTLTRSGTTTVIGYRNIRTDTAIVLLSATGDERSSGPLWSKTRGFRQIATTPEGVPSMMTVTGRGDEVQLTLFFLPR
jgi:hypothetical protein